MRERAISGVVIGVLETALVHRGDALVHIAATSPCAPAAAPDSAPATIPASSWR